MKLQPIFGKLQRDGRNKNGLTMFKCLHEGCGRRSSWKNQEHGHPKDEEKVQEKVEKES